MNIRELDKNELEGDEFRHLLWLSTEESDTKLLSIIQKELPQLTVLGLFVEELIGFAALDLGRAPTVIRYVAVSERAQGNGYGTLLVKAALKAGPSSVVYAETDDDAVRFYKKTGFTVIEKRKEVRFGNRQRYACMIADGLEVN